MFTTKRPVTLLALPVLAAPLALGACGSSGPAGGSGAGAAVAQAPASLCQQLDGIFADGPDPGTDPVGYALSQIQPLEGVHSSDRSVMADVSRLIAADTQVISSNGIDKKATNTIAKTDKMLDEACPGVAS